MKNLFFALRVAATLLLGAIGVASAGQWTSQDFINGDALSLSNSTYNAGYSWSNSALYCGYDGVWKQSFTSNLFMWSNSVGTRYTVPLSGGTHGMTVFPYWSNSVRTANSYNLLYPPAMQDVQIYPDANGNLPTNAAIFIQYTANGYEGTGTNTILWTFQQVPDGDSTSGYFPPSSQKNPTTLTMTFYTDNAANGATNFTFLYPCSKSTNWQAFAGSQKMRCLAITPTSDVAANGITNMIVTKIKFLQWQP